jgi:hypothetical protein
MLVQAEGRKRGRTVPKSHRLNVTPDRLQVPLWRSGIKAQPCSKCGPENRELRTDICDLNASQHGAPSCIAGEALEGPQCPFATCIRAEARMPGCVTK